MPKRLSQKRKNAFQVKLQYNKKQKKNTASQAIVLIDSDSEEESDSSNSSDSTILEYEKVRVTKEDRESLHDEKAWLNDNLIDFYLQYVKKSRDDRDQTYLFNSMFFMKLQRIQTSMNPKKEYYIETKAWFKDQTANRKSIWLIPICEGKHWYIMAISRPTSNKPLVFVFDSLRGRRKSTYSAIDLLKSFLIQKYKAEREGKFRQFKVFRVKIPQQDNSNDCGLYALRTADIILRLQQKYLQQVQGNESIDENNKIYKTYPIPTRKVIGDIIDNCIKKQS